jgi:uncharacterized membrane protein YqjE
MNRDNPMEQIAKVHRATAIVGMALSIITFLMTASLAVIHFCFDRNKDAFVITFVIWGALSMVCVIAQTWLLDKSRKLLNKKRDELDELRERLNDELDELRERLNARYPQP